MTHAGKCDIHQKESLSAFQNPVTEERLIGIPPRGDLHRARSGENGRGRRLGRKEERRGGNNGENSSGSKTHAVAPEINLTGLQDIGM